MKSSICDLVPKYLTPREAIQASFVETIIEMRNHMNNFAESGLYDEIDRVQSICDGIQIPDDYKESWRKYKDILARLRASVMP